MCRWQTCRTTLKCTVKSMGNARCLLAWEQDPGSLKLGTDSQSLISVCNIHSHTRTIEKIFQTKASKSCFCNTKVKLLFLKYDIMRSIASK